MLVWTTLTFSDPVRYFLKASFTSSSANLISIANEYIFKDLYLTILFTAPEGLDAPQLFVLNDTALHVAWLPPREPNGEVTNYFLYVDGQRMNIGGAETRSFILAGLEPYTIYAIQVGR